MAKLRFSKMHGLGNDFVVIDATSQAFDPNEKLIRNMGHRHFGVGFDQLLIIEKPTVEGVDFRYRIFNSDGGEVEQCGNGARCFMRYLRDKGLTDKKSVKVQTKKGNIVLEEKEDGLFTVNMGAPRFHPDEIPFKPDDKSDMNALQHMIVTGTLSIPLSVVNVGNPHAVIIVEEHEKAPIDVWGAMLEADVAHFPERVNVGFMRVIDRSHIRLKVFERGTGFTMACGTGACAAAVTAMRLGLIENTVTVSQDGGDLVISWQEGGDIMMSGPATFVYDAEADTDYFMSFDLDGMKHE